MRNRPVPLILGTLTLSLAYATARYNVFGTVPWTEWPLFIVNKGVSLAGLILISLSYLLRREPSYKRVLGLTGFWLTVVHVIVSILIFDAGHYAKLYASGTVSLQGWICLAAGALGLLALLAPAWSSRADVRERLSPATWRRLQRLGLAALALTAIHVVFLGVKGWIQPATWPGRLPPITMLSAAAALLPLLRPRRG